MNEIAASFLIYANAFVVGGVLMGFEMLGSRYLFPYFGSGTGTWAGLISTVSWEDMRRASTAGR